MLIKAALSKVALSGPFHRANVRRPAKYIPSEGRLPCLACSDHFGSHPVGQCPLKFAGFERCNLCGLAHYGIGTSCPHMNSEIACRTMLKNIKDSPEPRELKEQAIEYLKSVIAGLVRTKQQRREAAELARRSTTTGTQPLLNGLGQNGQVQGGPAGHFLPIPPNPNSYQHPGSSNNGPIAENRIPRPFHSPAPATSNAP